MERYKGLLWRGVLESTVSLTLGVLGEFAYSLALLSARGYLQRFPVILAIMPIMASKRGALYTTLGARLSTSLHLGETVGSFKDPWVRSQYFLNVLLIPLLAVYEGFILSLLVLGPRSLPIVIYVSITASYTALLILYPVTLGLAVRAFRGGWDPDNVLSPLITVLSDSLTLPTLLLTVIIYAERGIYGALIFTAILFLVQGVISFLLGRGAWTELIRRIKASLIQVYGATVLAILIESFTGGLMVKYTKILLEHPVILASLPVLMQAGGALSNIQASKISTMLHLGLYPQKYGFSKEFMLVSSRIILAAPYVYLLVSLVGYISALALGVEASFIPPLLLIIAAGFIMLPIVIVTSHFLSVLAYRRGLNPDNITLPIQTALMDLLSILAITLLLLYS